MSALGVVLDGVVGTEADPLGKGAVLPLLLGKSALGAEGLLGRLLVGMRDGWGGRLEKGVKGKSKNKCWREPKDEKNSNMLAGKDPAIA